MRGRLMMPRRSPTMGRRRFHPSYLSNLDTLVEADPQWVTVEDGKVAAIADQTGKLPYAQATPASRPTYVLDEVTGQYAISMDGRFMQRAVAATTALNYTAVIVVRMPTSARFAYNGAVGGVPDGWEMRVRDGARNHTHHGVNFMDDGPMSADTEVWVVVRDAGITRMFINGGEKALTNNNISIIAPSAISQLGGADGSFTGLLFSHVVYGRALSTAERKQLEGYLGAKYKVEVAP